VGVSWPPVTSFELAGQQSLLVSGVLQSVIFSSDISETGTPSLFGRACARNSAPSPSSYISSADLLRFEVGTSARQHHRLRDHGRCTPCKSCSGWECRFGLHGKDLRIRHFKTHFYFHRYSDMDSTIRMIYIKDNTFIGCNVRSIIEPYSTFAPFWTRVRWPSSQVKKMTLV